MLIKSAENKNTVITGIALAILLMACCIIVPHYLMQGVSVNNRYLVSRLMFWAALGVIFLYAKRVEQQPVLLFDESTRGVVFYIVSVVAILACVMAGTIVLGIGVKALHLNSHSQAVQNIFGLSTPIKVLTVTTAAIVEEFVFRGYLMSRLQLFFKGAFWPIVISSLIFGLGHMSLGTIINVMAPIWIGLVFAWHYNKYRNIKVLILCHFIIDFYALLIQH